MIVNANCGSKSRLQMRLDAIRDSANRYYLSGSRYFGTTHAQSDWDFFVEDKPEVRQELEQLGLSLIQKRTQLMYRDSLCRDIYTTEELGCDGIHVQLVSDVQLKHRAQEALKKTGLLNGVAKKRRKEIWNMVFSIILAESSKAA